MVTETLVQKLSRKAFLWVTTSLLEYKVERIDQITDEEIMNNELLDRYGIDYEDKYPLMTDTSRQRDIRIVDMEVGNIVVVDTDTFLVRLA